MMNIIQNHEKCQLTGLFGLLLEGFIHELSNMKTDLITSHLIYLVGLLLNVHDQ